MAEKFILMNLSDERMPKISEILKSKICKEILEILSEENLTESDLAKKMKTPLNTLEYNLKKLIDVGLVEKTNNFFWSKKGKKIPVYRAAKKSIVIQPKSNMLKSVVFVGIASLIMAFGIKIYSNLNNFGEEIIGSNSDLAYSTSEILIGKFPEISNTIISSGVPISLWFLAGSLITLLLLILINWRKL